MRPQGAAPDDLPIRVAHVITDLDVGGAEMVLVRLLERLDRRRFASLVVSLTPGGALEERAKRSGARVVSLRMRAGRPSAVALLRLARALRAFDPDVVQGWMYHANLAAWLASRLLARRPAVAWNIRQSLASLEHEKALTRLVIRLGARLSRRVERIVDNSEASVRQHVAIGFDVERFEVLPNGFDTAQFAPDPESRAALRRDLSLPGDAKIVGMVGRHHPVKGHAALLSAASLLARAGIECSFVLIGPGVSSDNRELVGRVRAAGVEERVRLLGAREDVERLMPAFDLLASPSLWAEGFPNVVGEAMACGVPCVVTDTGDSARIVGSSGVVVPTGDAEALARGIEGLLELPNDQRRALGEGARRRIVERYDIAAAVRGYERLYERLAPRGGPIEPSSDALREPAARP